MRRKLALCTSTAALALAAAPAFAQTASPASADKGSTTVQEVVVTGYRASLQSALNTKRNSRPADRVGGPRRHRQDARPERGRITSAPARRADRPLRGQGTTVLIDGLRQNLTTLNGDIFLTGKEFAVSGEDSGGGAGGNANTARSRASRAKRSAASTSIKNPDASMTEGGLGGTIDLKTRDPLDGPTASRSAAISAAPRPTTRPGDANCHPGRFLQVRQSPGLYRQPLLRRREDAHQGVRGLQPQHLDDRQLGHANLFGADVGGRPDHPAQRPAFHQSVLLDTSQTSMTSGRFSGAPSAPPGVRPMRCASTSTGSSPGKTTPRSTIRTSYLSTRTRTPPARRRPA